MPPICDHSQQRLDGDSSLCHGRSLSRQRILQRTLLGSLHSAQSNANMIPKHTTPLVPNNAVAPACGCLSLLGSCPSWKKRLWSAHLPPPKWPCTRGCEECPSGVDCAHVRRLPARRPFPPRPRAPGMRASSCSSSALRAGRAADRIQPLHLLSPLLPRWFADTQDQALKKRNTSRRSVNMTPACSYARDHVVPRIAQIGKVCLARAIITDAHCGGVEHETTCAS